MILYYRFVSILALAGDGDQFDKFAILKID